MVSTLSAPGESFFQDTVNRHLGSDGLVLDHRGTVEVNGDSSEHVSAMLAASSCEEAQQQAPPAGPSLARRNHPLRSQLTSWVRSSETRLDSLCRKVHRHIKSITKLNDAHGDMASAQTVLGLFHS